MSDSVQYRSDGTDCLSVQYNPGSRIFTWTNLPGHHGNATGSVIERAAMSAAQQGEGCAEDLALDMMKLSKETGQPVYVRDYDRFVIRCQLQRTLITNLLAAFSCCVQMLLDDIRSADWSLDAYPEFNKFHRPSTVSEEGLVTEWGEFAQGNPDAHFEMSKMLFGRVLIAENFILQTRDPVKRGDLGTAIKRSSVLVTDA
jgi:hypothetical protein